jgi:DeoR/GlpR family transcriptional regulator of sugar metabolism
MLAGDRVPLLAESWKFGTPSLHRICDVRNMHVVFTDTEVDPVLVQHRGRTDELGQTADWFGRRRVGPRAGLDDL